MVRTIKNIIVMLAFMPLVLGWMSIHVQATGVDFLDQANRWENLSGGLTVLKTCYIDAGQPDTTFGQGTNDYFVWPEDSAGTVVQAALVDFVWDSIFGYGPNKIPDLWQVDSTIITSARIFLKIETGGDQDSITIARSTIAIDPDGIYPTWNNPQPGRNWAGGGSFSWSNDAAPQGRVTTDTLSLGVLYAVDITEVWQDFADDTSKRTGLLIRTAGDASRLLRMYNAHKDLGNSKIYLEINWDEFGVKSIAIDSQRVAVLDTWINQAVSRQHYNYGGAFSLLAGEKDADNYGRILFDAAALVDSLPENNLMMDSLRLYGKVTMQSGAPTLLAHKLKRFWVEGDGVGFGSACGADWIHTQHATGGEGCAVNYNWGSAGADDTLSDREASATATIEVSGTGWCWLVLPDSIAQGMYDNRKINNPSRVNFTGLRLAVENESGTYLYFASSNAFGTTSDPYWVFYWTFEVEPTGGRRRPVSIDLVVSQGAYVR